MSCWLRLGKYLQKKAIRQLEFLILLRRAVWLYKYYESKEAIFLEVYVAENSRIREGIIQRVDWQGEPETIVEQLFAVTFELISPNKILAEWNKPGISQILHDYYNQDSGRASNAFHQFLIQTFIQRLQEEGF